jgi:hypothetical protein
MECKHILKIVGALITVVGGIISINAMTKPYNIPLAIFGAALAFGGRLLGEYGNDRFC